MATLGLLETDTLYPELLPDYGSYGRMFARFFGELDADLRYRYYQTQQGELPLHPDECDAFLITGSKAGVYDSLPWIAPLQAWIRDFHQRGAKIIGICFGHQIIAHSLGGHAAKSERGWGLGVHRTRWIGPNRPVSRPSQPPKTLTAAGAKADSEFNSEPNAEDTAEIRLLYSHQDQVQRLPVDATLLASSDFCPHAAFRIDRRVLCFQGHPEFTPDYLRLLLRRRISAIGEERYRQALATLDQPTDEAEIGRMLLAFIKNGG